MTLRRENPQDAHHLVAIPWDMAASSLDSIVLMHHTTRLPLSSLLTVSPRVPKLSFRVPKLSSCLSCHPESPSCHPERSEGSRPAPLSRQPQSSILQPLHQSCAQLPGEGGASRGHRYTQRLLHQLYPR